MSTPRHPYGLGRVVEHDPKSREFPAMVAAVKPKTILWKHTAPVLDQGQLGSCTGNALAQWLNTDFARQGTHKNIWNVLTEDNAVMLYSMATHLDRFPGYYPPTDTGSSGLAVCKAGVRQGYLTGYRWVFTFDAMVMALQHSPVIVGTEWTNAMFTPGEDGIIQPYGDPVGGHEYLVIGANLEAKLITILNSWGPGWGRNGRAYIPFDSFRGMLSRHGDVTCPVL